MRFQCLRLDLFELNKALHIDLWLHQLQDILYSSTPNETDLYVYSLY